MRRAGDDDRANDWESTDSTMPNDLTLPHAEIYVSSIIARNTIFRVYPNGV
jgi:hypothetical protein